MNRKLDKINQTLKITIICVVVFAVGYYVLNHISNRERPPLGNTFHIITGCVLMAVSALVLVITLKKYFFPKKRKKSKHVFLEDESKPRKEQR